MATKQEIQNKIDFLASRTEKHSVTPPMVGEILTDLNDREVDVSSMVEIEYEDLIQLRDNGELVPGMYYRITDYETTTVQDETQSAGHLFDVVVLALAVDKLSENAFATHSERDTEGYFADSKLEAWKLKYSLDNDTERYQWADDVNGKGVIYQMIDEWNNDLPYDFKNIMFKRYKIESTQSGKDDILNIVGKYNAAKENNLSTVYVVDEDDFEWFYTFSVFFMNDTVNVVDVSTKQAYVYSDEGFCYKTKNNIFGNSKTCFWDETLEKTFFKFFLGNNVIVHHSEENEGSTYDEFYGFNNNTVGNNSQSNTVGNNFQFNTVGNNFQNNTVGNNFYNNTVGNNFQFNTVGNDFNSNTIGNIFSSNTVGNGFYNNTVGDNFQDNTVGNYSQSNTVGNIFQFNTVGNSFQFNTVGNNSQNNTVGNDFQFNTVGNNSQNNTVGNDFYRNTVGNDFQFNTIGNYFYRNTVGNNFQNNTVGNDFQFNTVGNRFQFNTVGNNFRLNHVKDGLVGTSNPKKDWTVSEASVLYDKHYSATIYGYREATNVATTNTIIYYDGAGEQVKVTF